MGMDGGQQLGRGLTFLGSGATEEEVEQQSTSFASDWGFSLLTFLMPNVE